MNQAQTQEIYEFSDLRTSSWINGLYLFPLSGSVSLSPKHDHGLLADVIRILGNDEVDVLLLDTQLSAESNPVPAQQIGDVGDPQVRPVDRVEFPAVAGLAKEAVFRLEYSTRNCQRESNRGVRYR